MLLLDLPEEILFVILESAILPLDSREALPEPHSLLTCRTIHRIGLPILYRNILLLTNTQTTEVERTIRTQPKLVCHIRHLYASGKASWRAVFHTIGHANGSLETLDFVFRVELGEIENSGFGYDIWPPLFTVPVRRLVVRQFGYTHDPTLAGARQLAGAIEDWTSLEVVIIEPRMLLLPISRDQPSPLALALSRSPSLRVLRTPLPPEWNSSLLIASGNPSLVRIVLTKPQVFVTPDGFSSTDIEVSVAEFPTRYANHPWLVEAQKHPRLMKLIGALQGADDA